MLKNLNKFVPYQNIDNLRANNLSWNRDDNSRFSNSTQENKFEKTTKFKFKGSLNPLKKKKVSNK